MGIKESVAQGQYTMLRQDKAVCRLNALVIAISTGFTFFVWINYDAGWQAAAFGAVLSTLTAAALLMYVTNIVMKELWFADPSSSRIAKALRKASGHIATGSISVGSTITVATLNDMIWIQMVRYVLLFILVMMLFVAIERLVEFIVARRAAAHTEALKS